MERKALDKAIYLNKFKLKILASLTTLSIFSGIHIYNTIEDYQLKKYSKELMNSKIDDTKDNDDLFLQYQEEHIILANIDPTVEKKYKIENNNIVDNNGNIISLKDKKDGIYFYHYKLSENILSTINLKDSQIDTIGLNGSAVGNYIVDYLPSTLVNLSFKKCSFITDLSKLPDKCPNIEFLDLTLMDSLRDLSFIYKMPKLKKLYISESANITTELVNYLEVNNIENNIGIFDIGASIRVDSIIDEIIKPNMTDEEKIRAITLYVTNSINYNFYKASESNSSPLIYTLLFHEGVCTSYAYLTNVLLNKAGIDSFEIKNNDHAWNLIKLDDNYYYLDTTNISRNDFYRYILEKFGLARYYMIDTENTYKTGMTKPSDDKTMIPLDLIEDIAACRDNKTLLEKYGADIMSYGLSIGSIIAGIFAFLGIIPISLTGMCAVDFYLNVKEDYYEEIEKKLIKNLE